MISLYDIVEESSQIFEDFKSKYIRQAADSCKSTTKQKWRDVARYWFHQNIAWDKIEDKDIQVYSGVDVDDLLASFRKVKAGKEENYFLFGMKDEELQCIYFPEYTQIVNREGSRFRWYQLNTTRQSDYMTAKDQHAILKRCDYLLKISPKDFDVRKLRDQRYQAQKDMLPDLDEYDRKSKHNIKGELGKNAGGVDTWYAGAYYKQCSAIARINRERYKEIIAEMRMNKVKVDQKLIDMIDSTMTRYNKFMAGVITKSELNIKQEDVKYINRRIHDEYGDKGLIPILQRYYEYMQRITQEKTSSYTMDLMYEVDVMVEKLKAVCNEVDEVLKKYNF
jgi:hypothetical protein